MKLIKYTLILIFFYSSNVVSTEKDCSGIDKLSNEYAKCISDLTKKKANKLKENAIKKGNEVKEKITSDKNKKKLSNFKNKLKKFGESKTGSDFFKKK